MADQGKVKVDYRDKLQGASFAFSGMNFMVDPADLPIEGGQCVDICNCDIDYAANVFRRDGYKQILAADITTSWANTTTVYCVHFGKICTIVNNVVIPFINSPDMLDHVEFKQVNNIVVYSDGVTIGLIDAGVLYVFTNTVPFA